MITFRHASLSTSEWPVWFPAIMPLQATFATFYPLLLSLFLGFPTAGIHGILTRACLVEIEIHKAVIMQRTTIRESVTVFENLPAQRTARLPQILKASTAKEAPERTQRGPWQQKKEF